MQTMSLARRERRDRRNHRHAERWAPIVIGMLVEPGGATTANSAGIMALRKVPTFWAIAIAAHLDAALASNAVRAVLLIIDAFRYSWANMFRVG